MHKMTLSRSTNYKVYKVVIQYASKNFKQEELIGVNMLPLGLLQNVSETNLHVQTKKFSSIRLNQTKKKLPYVFHM